VPVDLAVVTPAYIDLTFVGLEALPEIGEERFAGELLSSPGGGAITAVGGARLGLSTALVAPLGEDGGGRFVREALEREGVSVSPARGARTPTTVVMPVGGDRAMVTVDPGVRASAADLEAAAPRAVVASLDLRDIAPAGADVYLTVGDDDARAYAGRLPRGRAARALVTDWREAAILTGADTPAEAAERLAAVAATVVINRGHGGAVASVAGAIVSVAGVDGGPDVDPTGDRDLLAAALAWADLSGAAPEDGVRWAVLYAGLSIRVHTGAAGAVTRSVLLEHGRGLGIAPPPGLAAS
jgi:ribokinase